MRTTYRPQGIKDYWTDRWADIQADSAMTNTEVYPLKYALQTVTTKDGPILEAGCGAGRILRYYHERGYDITGFDFIEVAIDKLREVDSTLQVEVGDITALRFADGAYRYLLAFGLYHNLERGLEEAVAESWRVLCGGGVSARHSVPTICRPASPTGWLTERRVRAERAWARLFISAT